MPVRIGQEVQALPRATGSRSLTVTTTPSLKVIPRSLTGTTRSLIVTTPSLIVTTPSLIATTPSLIATTPRVEVHVVAGILYDDSGRVLIAQRPAGKELSGRWEFPGGKVGADENALGAVVRELREELGIEVRTAARLMYYGVQTSPRTIWLDVWVVDDWSGTPQGLDRQELAWVEPLQLYEHDILEADAPIIAALERLAHRSSRRSSG
jgi:mutator protein MutT